MMATEATSETIATSSTIPNHELITTEIESSSHDVSSELLQPLLNGTVEIDRSKQDTTEHVDSNIVSAEASINGGSDTEASKTDTTKAEDEEKGHVRTASTVKKFASFKPVSVNKKFLAAKGPTAVSTLKAGDAAAGTGTAQAGSSTSATIRPRLVAKLGSGLRDSSPRNPASASGGLPGAAPDASAVWNKNRPAPPPEPKRMTDEELKQQYGIHLATRLESDAPGRQANWADIDDDDDDWAPETIEWGDGTKVALPSADDPIAREPSPITVVEPIPVEVAKPKSPAPPQPSAASAVKPSGFGGRAGLVLKGASEKPTLVAKPPGPPTPVKSPWAPLPPVDKAAPVVTEVPNQQPQQGRFVQRDPHGFHAMPPPPAKEIAADDFSRSGWRENNANTSRELYNSQSGRYEPVHERRGLKNESGRQPAVLQRPAPSDGPAEPSPAFQTHHNSQNASFGRRRTSSNVSGGSGNLARRMSRSHDMPPHESIGVRRGSLAAVTDTPSSPRNFSPSGHATQPRQASQRQNRSPVVSHTSPNLIHGQPILPPQGEAATTDNKTPVVYEDPVEYQKREMKEKREIAIKRRQEEEAKEEAARKERIRLKLEAMGPAPEKKKDKKDDKPAPTQIQTREVAPASASAPEVKTDGQVIKSEVAEQQSTKVPVVKPVEQLPKQDTRSNGSPDGNTVTNTSISQDTRPSQSWQSKSSSAWVPPPAPQTSSNVWGPPTNNKATLGNGTFNPELSASARSGPLGVPTRGSSQYQQGRGRGLESSRIAPIGPPSRQLGSQGPQQPRKMAPGWGELPEQLAREDALAIKDAEAERARREELEQKGLLVEPVQPTYQEVWHQVNINPDGTRSKVLAKVASALIDPAASKIVQDDVVSQHPNDARRNIDSNAVRPDHTHSHETWKGVQSPMGRTSRFFNNNRDVRLEEQNSPFTRPTSPSPPPPTMEGHPVYDGGNIKHPQINFPKPAPVVRLPPVAVPLPTPIGPPKQPLSFASVVTAPIQAPAQRRAGSQDIRREASFPSGPTGGSQWKEKINGLFPKNMVVDSATKHSLSLGGETTVSLPSSVSGDLAQDDASVTSKPASTLCFEEPQMGSLPIVKVPTKAPANAWSLCPVPKYNHYILTARDVTSASMFNFETEKPAADENAPHGSLKITIKLPGQGEAVKVNFSPRNGRGGRGRGSNRGYRGGRGARGGAPGGSSSPASTTTTPTQPSRGRRQNRGSHRGGNGRGDHTSSSWVSHQQPATAS